MRKKSGDTLHALNLKKQIRRSDLPQIRADQIFLLQWLPFIILFVIAKWKIQYVCGLGKINPEIERGGSLSE